MSCINCIGQGGFIRTTSGLKACSCLQKKELGMTEKQFDELLAKSWDTAQEAKIRANERQKVLLEIDKLQKACADADGEIDGITVLHVLRAKVQEMKEGNGR